MVAHKTKKIVVRIEMNDKNRSITVNEMHSILLIENFSIRASCIQCPQVWTKGNRNHLYYLVPVSFNAYSNLNAILLSIMLTLTLADRLCSNRFSARGSNSSLFIARRMFLAPNLSLREFSANHMRTSSSM